MPENWIIRLTFLYFIPNSILQSTLMVGGIGNSLTKIKIIIFLGLDHFDPCFVHVDHHSSASRLVGPHHWSYLYSSCWSWPDSCLRSNPLHSHFNPCAWKVGGHQEACHPEGSCGWASTAGAINSQSVSLSSVTILFIKFNLLNKKFPP